MNASGEPLARLEATLSAFLALIGLAVHFFIAAALALSERRKLAPQLAAASLSAHSGWLMAQLAGTGLALAVCQLSWLGEHINSTDNNQPDEQALEAALASRVVPLASALATINVSVSGA